MNNLGPIPRPQGPGRWAALAVCLTLLPTPALAHGPPEPRDFETRVMVDQNDDCGGHGGTDNCRGTHDLIGANVREAYDGQWGHVVILTLIADLGDPDAGKLTDTLRFQVGGATKAVVFETLDDETFTVAGAAKVDGPKALLAAGSPDGTRFTVDAWFQRGELGLDVGDQLKGFQVEAKAGSTRGDIMPGGYISPLTGSATDGSDRSTQYTRASYTLRGPDQYMRLTPDASVEVDAGATKFVNLRVKNLLSDMAQNVHYTADADNVEVGFHDPQSADQGSYPNPYDNAIPRGGEEIIHLAVTSVEAGTSGTIDVLVTTDRGGLATGSVSYTVPAADAPTATTTTPPDEDSPPGGLFAMLLALVLAAARRR